MTRHLIDHRAVARSSRLARFVRIDRANNRDTNFGFEKLRQTPKPVDGKLYLRRFLSIERAAR